MSVTFYTEQEYNMLAERIRALNQQVNVLEELRPAWAFGRNDVEVAAQGYANALSTLWRMLGAEDQTQAVQKLSLLLK